jgi:Bacterial SH3 domain/Family of unknown function (DUF6515)
MKQRTLIASLLMVGLIGAVPGPALADGHDHYKSRKEEQRHYRDRDHVRHGKKNHNYRGRRFNRQKRGGLVSVRAPIGAIIASLPFGVAAVAASGNTSFHAEESYYRQVPRGSMVCEAPLVTPSSRHYDKRHSRTAVVRPALLNVRSGPGRSFAVSGQVVRGDRLHIRSTTDGWYYVETSRGIGGWVMMRFTSPYVTG